MTNDKLFYGTCERGHVTEYPYNSPFGLCADSGGIFASMWRCAQGPRGDCDAKLAKFEEVLVPLAHSKELQKAVDEWRAVDPLYRDVTLVGLEAMLKKQISTRAVILEEHAKLLDAMEKVRALAKAAAK